MEALNKNNRRIVPNQRLFFKPLIRNEFDRRETVKMGLDVEEKPKKIGFKMANDEIENIMDRIHDEIKAIDIEKGVSKEKIIEKFEESAFDSRLAQSILYKKQSDKECFQNVIYVKSPSSPSIFSSEKIVNSVKLAVNRNSSRPLTALQKSG